MPCNDIYMFYCTCVFSGYGERRSAGGPGDGKLLYSAAVYLRQNIPPLVMVLMAKDEKLFYKAYSDLIDLDEDSVIDDTYKDAISDHGYFNSSTCYDYNATNNRFEPQSAAFGTNLHYCSGRWSGNFLNWATMARIDILRKVLYGGKRTTDRHRQHSCNGPEQDRCA